MSFNNVRTEVERAAEVIRLTAQGKFIAKVETTEDTIVYEGIDHSEFVGIIKGACRVT